MTGNSGVCRAAPPGAAISKSTCPRDLRRSLGFGSCGAECGKTGSLPLESARQGEDQKLAEGAAAVV